MSSISEIISEMKAEIIQDLTVFVIVFAFIGFTTESIEWGGLAGIVAVIVKVCIQNAYSPTD